MSRADIVNGVRAGLEAAADRASHEETGADAETAIRCINPAAIAATVNIEEKREVDEPREAPRWTTSWPDWTGCTGNVEVVPAIDYEHALLERNDALLDLQHEALETAALRRDAERWRWLRSQAGWPDSEAGVSGKPPEFFDAMADTALAREKEAKG